MDESLVKFTRQEIDIGRVESLARLVAACQKNEVELQQVFLYQNGFQVLFKDLPGDAILHDGSYGRNQFDWETIGYPWDGEDVSVHEPEELAGLLGKLKRGEETEPMYVF